MPAAFTSLTISDSVTTCNLVDGTNYQLVDGGWAPQLPARRISTLGGFRYDEVTEEITINVLGSTGAVALANLQTLIQLLDQAADWWSGGPGNQVELACIPQGSNLTLLVSPILGPLGAPLVLPPTFNDLLMLFEISNVTIRFRRLGMWLTGEGGTASAAAANPSILTATFPAAFKTPSPVTLWLSGLPVPTSITALETGYLLVAREAAQLKIINTSSMVPATDYSSVAGADQPLGAAVLRFIPTVTTARISGTVTLSDWDTGLIGIVAAVRNHSTDRTFDVVARVRGYGVTAETSPYFVDVTTTNPQIVCLGVIAGETYRWQTIELQVTVSALGGGGTNQLDIDYLALVALDDPCSRIISHGPVDLDATLPAASTHSLFVQSRLTASASDTGAPQPTPTMTFRTSGVGLEEARPAWHRGDIRLLQAGISISVIYCGRNSPYWRVYDPVAAAAVSLTLNATRYPAYLVPQ